MENKNIKTAKNLLKIFKSQFLKEKNIDINIQNYLNSYGEIIQLYESFDYLVKQLNWLTNEFNTFWILSIDQNNIFQ